MMDMHWSWQGCKMIRWGRMLNKNEEQKNYKGESGGKEKPEGRTGKLDMHTERCV